MSSRQHRIALSSRQQAQGHNIALKTLIDAGANKDARNGGQTALDAAVRNGKTDSPTLFSP